MHDKKNLAIFVEIFDINLCVLKWQENMCMLGLLPGKRDQMRLFIEIHRVSVRGQPEHKGCSRHCQCVTARIFTLQGKQTGKGWRTEVLCIVGQLCVYPIMSGFHF